MNLSPQDSVSRNLKHRYQQFISTAKTDEAHIEFGKKLLVEIRAEGANISETAKRAEYAQLARDIADRLFELTDEYFPIRLELPPAFSITEPSIVPVGIQNQEMRIRQAVIDKVRTFWIDGVLEKSLYGTTRIELELKYILEAVERPWMMTLERSHTPQQAVVSSAQITNLFYEFNGSFLILGEPGAGKTTTLLVLARDLLKLAEEDNNQPIPIVLNLSSWGNKKLPFFDWLVEGLSNNYQIHKKLGREWLENQSFHLLLDGLDEVNSQHREDCAQAINHFRAEYGFTSIVVCSRVADYDELTTKLNFPGAVIIQPLTQEQIEHFLATMGDPMNTLRTSFATDNVLETMARSPLILSIMILAYQGLTAKDLTNMSLEERQNHLLTTYVDRMFERRRENQQYTQEQAIHWLSWLASRMSHRAQSIFHIEKLQPDWLSNDEDQKVYKLVSGLIFGLVGGLIFGLVSGLIFGLVGGLIFGLVGGLIFGLMFGSGEIRLVETVNLNSGLIGSLAIGLTTGLVSLLVTWLIDKLTTGLALGLGVGLVAGLLFGLTIADKQEEVKDRTIPNQGVNLSIRNAFRISLANGLTTGLVFGLVFGLANGLAIGLVGGLTTGLAGGIMGWMVGGGGAAIKHYLLRFIISNHEDALPIQLAPFLDHMSELIILRRVGGGYMFIHRMLMEYFAMLGSSSLQEE